MHERVSFIGLGVMGFPMAGYLAANGHQVSVYNRTGSRSEDWASKHKGTICTTPRSAATGSYVVFCCVGNDEDLRSVTLNRLSGK